MSQCPTANEPIDVPIRNVIKLFTDLGFITRYSCAGYGYPGHKVKRLEDGFKSVMFPHIIFDGKLENVRQLSAALFATDWVVSVTPYHFMLHYIGKNRVSNEWKKLTCYFKEMRRRFVENDKRPYYAIVHLDRVEFIEY